ncbi:MAG: cellulase family glycosylhydrolase [Prevotella sp.]|nr:cellulase family glycosylhydrolase [Prevotella sp.]
MNIKIITTILLAIGQTMAMAADFETATQAVANMKVGWNLGNTLESNSGDVGNMWIEAWTDKTPAQYETAWGQPVTKPELLQMFKEAGFNAIRVPVTWYPHMEATFGSVKWDNAKQALTTWDQSADDIGTKVQAAWMQRVHEVVDYVISQGMYCNSERPPRHRGCNHGLGNCRRGRIQQAEGAFRGLVETDSRGVSRLRRAPAFRGLQRDARHVRLVVLCVVRHLRGL